MDKSNDSDEASSSKSDFSGEACSSAQFIWQIKGQYHFKCSDDEGSSTSNSEKVNMNSPSDLASSSENISESDRTSSAEDLQAANNAEHQGESTSPSRQVSRAGFQLVKWHTRQLAQAVVDNTINSVIEDLGFGPVSVETEDIVRDGNLEHEAVSMAILSHGLQRSSHDTCTTSSHVNSHSSHSTYKYNRMSYNFLDGLSKVGRVRTAHDAILSNNQTGASCSFSSSKQVYQKGGVVVLSSDIVAVGDRTIVSTENSMTEHSKPHCKDGSQLQPPSNNLSPVGIFTQPQADCDVPPPIDGGAHDKLPSKACAGNLTQKSTSPPRETLLSPFHKRKAEDIIEISKRCCQESSSALIKSDHINTPFKPDPSDESISNIQLLYDKAPSFEHFDFMDAAVAVAIQKKGLSALAGAEYG